MRCDKERNDVRSFSVTTFDPEIVYSCNSILETDVLSVKKNGRDFHLESFCKTKYTVTEFEFLLTYSKLKIPFSNILTIYAFRKKVK